MSDTRKLILDNIGHLLTLISLIVSGAAMWQAMDKRVLVLEEARTSQRVIDTRQDNEIVENKKNVREDLKEINNKLDRLIERK
ncbi:hypothetical protein [Undibacterium umbellatum]|uniref:Uncharacterized protein n=1 Tax=Undibacterium umbellatum TaxID=2762300 RepID=A0ABR6Z3B5_9BURK|nr:hypothetical protein [Undibacterium umbellatum]MBC3906200.1 hypothetical protein [Undibacterium umbellatum]